MQRQKIHNLAVELSKNLPGSSDYLSNYHKARVQVEEELTDDQRQSYKVMAKDWSSKQLPPRMQQRYVHGVSQQIRIDRFLR